NDDANGAGIAGYDVFVSVDGGAFAPWLASTTQTAATYSGAYGHSYAFYSVATDNLGHREATPAGPQALTRLEAPPIPPAPPPAPPPQPMGVFLFTQRRGKKVTSAVRVMFSHGLLREIVVPFQKPAFTAISATLHDSNGDGILDSVLFSARRDRKK